jgi:signal transduction histidine kinase
MGLVGNIAQSTIRMIDLVNALLDVSRIEAGHISVNPEPTDLKELINQVLIELQNSIDSKKIKMHFSIEDALPSISLDPKLARQVYMNLLTNAIKYTHESGEVNISISRNGSRLQSEISDNGIGIPEKDLPRICEKFFRAPNAAKFDPEGNGLGMYLVKSIVNSLGGDFSIESQEGKGTLVRFSFLIN